MAAHLIHLESPSLRYTGVSLANPHSVSIPEGLTVIVGPNGAGKTTLAKIIERGWNFATNRISSPRGKLEVRYVEFSDIHSLSGFKAGYYQQRYESGMNIEVPSVRDVMGDRLDSPQWRALAEAMRLGSYEAKPMNALSSGELRKLLVIHQLTSTPDLLILDNPYIGLDAPARDELDAALKAIVEERRSSILLLVGNLNEVPSFAEAVIPVSGLTILEPVAVGQLDSLRPLLDFPLLPQDTPIPFHPDLSLYPEPGAEVVRMRGCSVSYGNARIIDSISWEMHMGEHWILSGPNGAGKSTLLSLVHADHPQGYANDLSLFGRRRGTGESIWDIKKRIGYVSPEMHLYFNGGHSLGLHVVAQGLNDTVGQYKALRPDQLALAEEWLSCLNLTHLADRPFRNLSSGEQRMLLLARTLIKNPPLLILDEPLHGLDQGRKRFVRDIIERLASSTPRFSLVYVTHRPEEAPSTASLHLRLPHRP